MIEDQKPLTPKQESFAQGYVEAYFGNKDAAANASEAYRQAYDAKGMADKTVWEAASRLLANSKVAARIEILKERHMKRHDVTIDRVLQEYAKLAFLDIRKAFDEDGHLKDIHEIDDETAAAISGIEVEQVRKQAEVEESLEGQPHGGALKRSRGTGARLHKLKLTDKKGALDSLAKYLGMFIDRHEVTGKDGGPIVTKEQRDAAVAAALGADA